jgi:hypothetical protein
MCTMRMFRIQVLLTIYVVGSRDHEDCDFFQSFQSPIIAASMSLTAVRSHLPERLFRSAAICALARAVPR